jgi:glycosyltransferase involved in cell wall biosynthesis
MAYSKRIREYARQRGVSMIHDDSIPGPWYKQEDDQPDLFDTYPGARLVAYPSKVEGFGNAFLEAVYFKRPIMINQYAVFEKDIKGKGFITIELSGGKITPEVRSKVLQAIEDRKLREETADHNYRVASEHYSYRQVREKVLPYLD